jgi:eukaryotic-like serine/threonine-protein kinase
MIGQSISHYEILEKLGEGGMGVVYKAHDTKLDRFVALKFLPPHLNASEQDKARFTQEAKAAAALNHPNVCSIIDIQQHEGQMFLVMEFIDGQTLRERKSTITTKQAIDIGIQVADGLAAAHEKGIVHRDIKPENIMVRKDGIVQIMDFGLAKLRGVSKLTKEGSTIGTAGYMSPEQVQGLDADHRSDIFSYGVLLFELLTGQLPFRGVHETAVAYEIVNVDAPPMSSIKPEIDPSLDAIVLECLAKEPSDRSQSMAEVAKDLRHYKRESSRQHLSRTFPAQSGIRQSGAKPSPEVVAALPRWNFLPWGISGLLFVVAAALLVRQFLVPATEKPLMVFSILPPDSVYIHSYGQASGPPVISPDGRNIAFVGVTPSGLTQLYVRSLKENSTHPLDGTRKAQYPFWSPDGKYIGFFAGAKIKKVDIEGGSPVTICDAWNPRGATWNSAGMILFSPDFQSPLFSVPADGGAVIQITKLDSTRNESSHRWPYALPDGNHFLYFARVSNPAGEGEGHAIFVSSLDGKDNKLLLHTSSNAVYASGKLLFTRGSKLMAQQFDLSSLQLKGDPSPITEDVMDDGGFNLSVFSASESGILLYQTGHAAAGAKLLLADRNGKITSTVGDKVEYFRPRYSPNGEFIMSGVFDPKLLRLNIWEFDLRTGGRNRITSGTGENYPNWSSDGTRIIYSSSRNGNWNIYEKSLSGTSDATALLGSSNRDWALDWSRDGSFVLFSRTEPTKIRTDLWILHMNGNHETSPLLNTDFDEPDGRFSPDGKWVACVSNESGEYEVYILPAKNGDNRKWKVSQGGGGIPRWAGDNELCFVNSENQLVLATLRFKDNMTEVVSLRVLFSMPAFLEGYDISRDGKSILINRYLEQQKSAPLTLMVNWDKELNKR